jgi:hypothetical protein
VSQEGVVADTDFQQLGLIETAFAKRLTHAA